MERVILPGRRYRHFKNREYEVLCIATHSETRERMVVYRALYGEGGCWVRPYEMFAGEVDHDKYPDVTQRWRFELIGEDEA